MPRRYVASHLRRLDRNGQLGPDSRRIMKPVLLSLLSLVAASLAWAAQPVFPPGSRIGLVPPAHMAPARGLTGFRNAETGAGILLVEMPPDAFPSLAASLTDQALKAQGFALRSRDKVPVGSGTAIMVTGEQVEGGRRMIKSLLLAADSSMTALVMGQLPPGSKPEEIAAVEQAMRTVAFRPPLTLDEKIEALPFSIGDRAGFRPVRTMAGNSLLLTDGPSDVVQDVAQPILIVAESFGPPPVAAQRETFARGGLLSNSFIKDAVLERSQGYRQGGAEWHELVAKARDVRSGKDVVVMQTIRFEPDSYIRRVEIVRPGEGDPAFPRLRRIVDSIAPK